jgi:hypothetical protein
MVTKPLFKKAKSVIKNNKKRVTKYLNFLWKSIEKLRNSYLLLKKRYMKVVFPQINICKRIGNLYKGYFTVIY